LGFLIAVTVILFVILSANYFMSRMMKIKEGDEIDASSMPAEIAGAFKEAKTLLYFFSPACAKCRSQEKIFEQMKEKFNHIIKIDATKDRATSNYFGIKGTPTMILLKRNNIAGIMIGVQNEKTLLSKIENL